MEKIGLLIDSTSLTTKELEKYDFIKKVYLKVSVDGENFLEKDLTKEQMLKNIENHAKMLTSQPSPGDFVEVLQEFEKEKYTHVIVIVLSEKISGTFQSALLAKKMIKSDLNVTVHSPNAASFGIANGLRLLSKDIENKMTYDDVLKRYYEIFKEPLIAFTLSNLKHLFKGGRLNRVQALIGTVLRIKPIVQMIDGKLEMVQKERTNIACQEFFLEKIDAYVKKYENVYLDIINLNMEKWGAKLKKAVEEKYPKVKIYTTDYVSPVFYVHLGDKGFGISVIAY
ncbi:MAG: DegV family protein [Candidatus Izimaplasma sp.]|nr:DegV family protein [Candidatus Izimaplasma bacterium]